MPKQEKEKQVREQAPAEDTQDQNNQIPFQVPRKESENDERTTPGVVVWGQFTLFYGFCLILVVDKQVDLEDIFQGVHVREDSDWPDHPVCPNKEAVVVQDEERVEEVVGVFWPAVLEFQKANYRRGYSPENGTNQPETDPKVQQVTRLMVLNEHIEQNHSHYRADHQLRDDVVLGSEEELQLTN